MREVVDSESEKKRKREDQKPRRESEAQKKKFAKTLTSHNKEKAKEEKRQKTEFKLKPEDANRLKKDKPQDPRKKEEKKLKEASQSRREALKEKPKRKVSEKEKAENKVYKDEKKARLAEHFKQKAASRASLEKQKAGLESEIKALNKISDVRETIDGQYTAKFSGFESAIAAGPMGATSTGLRKLDPSVWINMKRAEAGAKVQNKLDPQTMKVLAKIKKVAKDLKLTNIKNLKSDLSQKVQATKEVLATEQKIEHSKLRSKIKEMKTREIMRDPNRNPSKFDELNMPHRGVGGTGGV